MNRRALGGNEFRASRVSFMNESLKSSPDPILIAAAVAGERAAFGELVCRYQHRLLNALYHLLGNELEAQDVAQDSLVLAFTKLHTFRGQSSFFTWLFRIARNTAISRLRRERKLTSIEGHLEQPGLTLVGSAPAPDARMLRNETIGRVRLALSRLSEEHRSILILREIEDLDYDAIALALDLPVGTVRSRLHRARLQMKAELEALELAANETSPARLGE